MRKVRNRRDTQISPVIDGEQLVTLYQARMEGDHWPLIKAAVDLLDV